VKRTTGIPRSFLKTVEKPTALVNDGTMDDTKLPSGVMVNAEGDFVIAEPDKASWEKFQAKTNSSAAAQKAAAAGDKELQEMGLECSIDKRIFIDPMKTPCCEKTYCNECITNALIESDFTCPGCQTDGVLIDDLKPDVDVSTKIKNYLEEKTAAKKEADAKERSKSPVVKRELTPTAADVKARTKSPPPKPGHKQNQKSNSNNKSKSPPAKKLSPNAAKSTPVPAATPTGPNTKKRPADELLENPKIPKGPKAMQQQATQQKNLLLQQQQAMMTSMGGMPNFPMAMDPRGWNGMPNMMMPGMNGMPMMNMNGMNPMMNFGGYPNMYANMNGGGMGMNNGGGMNGGMAVANGFPNQQKTIFAEPLPNEEDNAYFRKPVNPHRHQGKQRRNRPSDYREL
jgi:protein MPE1